MFSFFFFSFTVTYLEDTKQDFQFLLKQPKKVECELQENCVCIYTVIAYTTTHMLRTAMWQCSCVNTQHWDGLESE